MLLYGFVEGVLCQKIFSAPRYTRLIYVYDAAVVCSDVVGSVVADVMDSRVRREFISVREELDAQPSKKRRLSRGPLLRLFFFYGSKALPRRGFLFLCHSGSCTAVSAFVRSNAVIAV